MTLAQLYRDRADSENAVDELKNQWGWGEFTTQDITRRRLSAMGVALAYNWWSLFVRLANPTARLEAITSGMTRKTRHAGQQHLTIAPMYGNGAQGMGLPTQVSQLDEGTNTHCGAIAPKIRLAVRLRADRHTCHRLSLAHPSKVPPYLCPKSP